jgi:hypothetical protein
MFAFTHVAPLSASLLLLTSLPAPSLGQVNLAPPPPKKRHDKIRQSQDTTKARLYGYSAASGEEKKKTIPSGKDLWCGWDGGRAEYLLFFLIVKVLGSYFIVKGVVTTTVTSDWTEWLVRGERGREGREGRGVKRTKKLIK